MKILKSGKLDELIKKIPFKRTLISGAFLLGLAGCELTDYPFSVQDGGIDASSEQTITDASNPSINHNYKCGDLSWYPEAFQTEGVFNGYFVVGEAAKPMDNLSMTDIATAMWYTNNKMELERIQVVDALRLDTEITDIGAQNLIIIGNPCYNGITAEVLGNPADCTEGFTPGKARVKMLKNKETNNLAMIVAGYGEEDTRLAAKVIAHRWKELQQANGCEVVITGTDYNNAVIESAE